MSSSQERAGRRSLKSWPLMALGYGGGVLACDGVEVLEREVRPWVHVWRVLRAARCRHREERRVVQLALSGHYRVCARGGEAARDVRVREDAVVRESRDGNGDARFHGAYLGPGRERS
jgi:hypothetical protein